MKVGDTVFVRNVRESFPVRIVEISGKWILGLGTGLRPDIMVLEWFALSSKNSNVITMDTTSQKV